MKLFKSTARLASVATLGLSSALAIAPSASAGNDVFLGEIILVGYTFCPRGYASAEGQLLAISQYSALFSLYGTTYGGDGRTTFALPDLRGRVPMGLGNGPGLSSRQLGQKGGAENRSLTTSQLPSHSHAVNATNEDGDRPGPGGKLLAAAPPGGAGTETIYSDQPATKQMSASMIGNTGGGQPVDTQDPYTVMRYCVATQGIFPSRS